MSLTLNLIAILAGLLPIVLAANRLWHRVGILEKINTERDRNASEKDKIMAEREEGHKLQISNLKLEIGQIRDGMQADDSDNEGIRHQISTLAVQIGNVQTSVEWIREHLKVGGNERRS